MRTASIIVSFVLMSLGPHQALAQEPVEQAAQKPTPPARAQAPRIPVGNVRVEVSIADYLIVESPQTKTVSMLVAEGFNGRVRSASGGPVFAVLNVDATPRLLPDGRISLQLTLEYRPGGKTEPGSSPINEQVVVLLQSGKPLVVTQAADPNVDRKVAVEVTATLLK
jgi:hypothetical protein